MNLVKQLSTIVSDDILHAKWLNTLSLMENCGARKIAAFEHPVHTNLIILKHAAEEFRHAYYLKKQMGKLFATGFDDYSDNNLLAATSSRQYLTKLDIAACRLLKNQLGLTGRDMHYGAYLLVTYAIEVRADSLYADYQNALSAGGSNINVKSIIMEEAGHLSEMEQMLTEFREDWKDLASSVCKIEAQLFSQWSLAIAEEIEIAALAH